MAFTTHRSLLTKVGAGDEVSWRDFYNTYKPLVILHGRDFRLTRDELEDLVQHVMTEIFSKDIIAKFDFDKLPEDLKFHYDASHGRFRHYLRKIIRNQAISILRKRHSMEFLEDHPEVENTLENDHSEDWDAEWHKHLLTMALEELKSKVQPDTYLAFEMYALQNRSAKEIAEFLNISVGSIYTAKSRCIDILQELVRTLDQ